MHHMEGNNVSEMVDNRFVRAIIEAWCLSISAALAAQDEETIRMAGLSVERAVAGMSEEAGGFLSSVGASKAAGGIHARLEYLKAVEEMRLLSAVDFAGRSRAVSAAVSRLRRRLDAAFREQRLRVEEALPSGRREAKPRPGPSQREASTIVPRSKVIGPVMCLPDVPEDQKPPATREAARVKGWMDGRRDLAACIRMGFHEVNAAPTEDDYRAWIQYVVALSKYGYFEVRRTRPAASGNA
jgi:hypothetical protein